MQTYRVTLVVEWRPNEALALPLEPTRSGRRGDGRFELDFDVEAESFDHAAGQLWGEAAACGLAVVRVEPARPLV